MEVRSGHTLRASYSKEELVELNKQAYIQGAADMRERAAKMCDETIRMMLNYSSDDFDQGCLVAYKNAAFIIRGLKIKGE